MKIGRNDPCHCGSGQKYKKCCESKDDAVRSAELAALAAARAATSEAAADGSSQANAPSGLGGSTTRAGRARSPLQPKKGPPPPSPSMIRKRAV